MEASRKFRYPYKTKSALNHNNFVQMAFELQLSENVFLMINAKTISNNMKAFLMVALNAKYLHSNYYFVFFFEFYLT